MATATGDEESERGQGEGVTEHAWAGVQGFVRTVLGAGTRRGNNEVGGRCALTDDAARRFLCKTQPVLRSPVPMPLSRSAVLDAIVAALEHQLGVARAAADIARDEATNEETKQESKYDTRAIEAGYLAGAQSRRLGEMAATLGRYARLPREVEEREVVDGPALVGLSGAEGEVFYFVGPGAAGLRVTVDGVLVRVVSPSSPLGGALVGAEVDDEIVLPSGERLELVCVL